MVIAIHLFISLMLIQKMLIESLPGAKHSEASLDTRPCLSSCPCAPAPARSRDVGLQTDSAGTSHTCVDSHGGWSLCPAFRGKEEGMCLHSSQALPGCGGCRCHQEAPVNEACLISLAGRWCQPAGSRQESSSHASDSPNCWER